MCGCTFKWQEDLPYYAREGHPCVSLWGILTIVGASMAGVMVVNVVASVPWDRSQLPAIVLWGTLSTYALLAHWIIIARARRAFYRRNSEVVSRASVRATQRFLSTRWGIAIREVLIAQSVVGTVNRLRDGAALEQEQPTRKAIFTAYRHLTTGGLPPTDEDVREATSLFAPCRCPA